MSELNFNSVSIEKLVTLIKPKQGQTESIISPQTYLDSWNSFIKWAKLQLDQDRTVIIPNFVIITSGPNLQEDKERQIFVQLLDIFVTNNNLLFKRTPNLEKKYPTVKLNYTAISKGASVDQEIAVAAIHTLVAQIKEVLIAANNCEIDMGQLGKFIIIDRMIQFAPLQQGKVSQIAAKKTVQNLLEANKAFQKQYDLKNSSLLKDNSSILRPQQQQPFDFQGPLESNKVRLEPLRGSLSKSIGKFAQAFQQSPTRKVFKQEEIKIIPEMLGAGTNPKSLDCHNSVLAANAKGLMEANFMKPPYAKIRHPPILDRFQRFNFNKVNLIIQKDTGLANLRSQVQFIGKLESRNQLFFDLEAIIP